MFGSALCRGEDHKPMCPKIWVICISFLIATVGPSQAGDLSAVLTRDNVSLNAVVVGEVKENRSILSLPGLVQALGVPSRTQVQGGTERITWDEAGIQLEATAPEMTPFALFFAFGRAYAGEQGVVPSGHYGGAFDCLGIKLRAAKRIEDLKSQLAAARFNQGSPSNGKESWSIELEHWTIFLQFNADGTIDSAVVRVRPDMF